jgi:hypothetical protein
MTFPPELPGFKPYQAATPTRTISRRQAPAMLLVDWRIVWGVWTAFLAAALAFVIFDPSY